MADKSIEITLEGKNIDINYKHFVGGEGSQTILILHGWRGSSDSWKEAGELLHSNGYNVIIPDIPCASTKTVCEREFNLEEYAELIEDFYTQINLENIILWGHSNGGALSILLENRKNINISQLILNNSAGIRQNPQRSLKRKILNFFTSSVKKIGKICKIDVSSKDSKLRKIFYKCIGGQDYLEAEKNEFLHKTYLNMIQTDLSEEMTKITTPTTLIRGEKDSYTPVGDCHTMNNTIKNSKKIVLDGETHGIHLKSPERLVQTFISSL